MPQKMLNGWRNWQPALKAAALLMGFALLGTTLVGLSQENTTDRIQANQRATLLQQLSVITPAHDNDLLHNPLIVQAPAALGSNKTTVYRAWQGQRPIAAIFSPVIAQGYSGAINLIIAIRFDGTLSGVRVISHHETPGLGDKIEHERDPWITHFRGKHLHNPKRWKVKRDGGDFDQFTGATITPRVVVTAIHKTLVYFQRNKQWLFK
jgi:electron transport complex protein RnfG